MFLLLLLLFAQNPGIVPYVELVMLIFIHECMLTSVQKEIQYHIYIIFNSWLEHQTFPSDCVNLAYQHLEDIS
jgi:hypothetical protein